MDKTPSFNNSFAVYQFNSPGFCASYAGKTEEHYMKAILNTFDMTKKCNSDTYGGMLRY